MCSELLENNIFHYWAHPKMGSNIVHHTWASWAIASWAVIHILQQVPLQDLHSENATVNVSKEEECDSENDFLRFLFLEEKSCFTSVPSLK